MRIAIFGARGIPAKWGGFDTFVTNLAPRLAAKGHDITVFCMPKYSQHDKPPVIDGVHLIYLPTIYGKTTETLLHELLSSLYALFRLRRFDIYYILGCRSTMVYLPHYWMRRTLVINTDGLDWIRRKWGWFARNFLRFNYWIARKIGKQLVSDSFELKKYYLENYKKETVFLTNGGEIIEERHPEVVRKYGLEPGEYCLVACRMEPENNIDIIISEFSKTSLKKRLVIAGGANYKSPYFEQLKRTDDCRILFLGPVYEEGHIEQLHLHAYLYLHGHEVGGTNPSLLKAMACGNIIIAHDVRFNREVLDGNGLMWDKNEGSLTARLTEADKNYKQYQKTLPGKCIERIRTCYSWDKVGRDHELFFRWVNGEADGYNESF
jgi:glycosyltransferase involved in cell wall biosynthesis